MGVSVFFACDGLKSGQMSGDLCGRQWWAGKSDAKHDKLMVACDLHPDTAPKMLGLAR